MSFRLFPFAAVAASAISAAAFAAPTVKAAQAQAQAPAAQRTPTRADVIRNIDARFAAVDTNKDGSLSAAEVGVAQTRALQAAGVQQQQRIDAEFKRLFLFSKCIFLTLRCSVLLLKLLLTSKFLLSKFRFTVK